MSLTSAINPKQLKSAWNELNAKKSSPQPKEDFYKLLFSTLNEHIFQPRYWKKEEINTHFANCQKSLETLRMQKLHNKKLCLVIGRTSDQDLPSALDNESWFSADIGIESCAAIRPTHYNSDKTPTQICAIDRKRNRTLTHIIMDMNNPLTYEYLKNSFHKIVFDWSVAKFLDVKPKNAVIISKISSLLVIGKEDSEIALDRFYEKPHGYYSYLQESETFYKSIDDRAQMMFKIVFKEVSSYKGSEYPIQCYEQPETFLVARGYLWNRPTT